ncbi:MAG TPA: hypothetical protein VF547_00165 [Allosphingosinicella sp.]|jgi:hypothetical protein
MNSPEPARHSFGMLLRSQLRATGLAIHREAGLAAAALALAGLLVVTSALRYHEELNALPEILLATLPIALLLPWAVWRGDPVFGRAYLWTLPVRRQRAAAAKIAAGALWLVAILLVAMASIFAMAAITGGTFGTEETRLVGPFGSGPAAAVRVPWTTPLWMWLAPFGGALTLYVASSAALVGLRHPLRWLGGVAVAVTLLMVIALNMESHNPLHQGLGRLAEALVGGRWGLDFALTGGAAALSEEIDLPGPGSVTMWRALPTAGAWAAALAAWLGAALLALALALRRHWER